MARPIEYNKNEVLRNAMETFWHRGYESTSMKDLVSATGLTTRSMYNIFESKKGLFQASLDWYYQSVIKVGMDKLREEDGLEAIKNFLIKITGVFDGSNGCLYTNTMSDRYSIDETSITVVDSFFQELEALLVDKLTYARDYEGYKNDPDIRAKYLVIVIQGMSVYSKKFKSSEERKRVLEDVLMMIYR